MDKNVYESPLFLRNVYEIFGVFVRVYECLGTYEFLKVKHTINMK